MKKLVLIIVSALIVVGLSACGTQKKVAEAKKQQKNEDQKIVKKLNSNIDSLTKVATSLQVENKELQADKKLTSALKKTVTALNGQVDSLIKIAIKLQGENQQLTAEVAKNKETIFGPVDYIDSLFVANEMAKEHGTATQLQPKVLLDTMTWITYELKDSVWVKVTNGKSVKMPKKGEIGVSEDKTEIYIRGSDIDAISDEEIATWQFLNHKIMQVNK